MLAIVTPRLRWTGLAILTLHFPLTTLAAQQTERYSIPGGDVAIYNLAGEVKVEPGSGVVTAELTRGGADAAKLKVLQGEIDGWEALRVTYPADRIHYDRVAEIILQGDKCLGSGRIFSVDTGDLKTGSIHAAVADGAHERGRPARHAPSH